MVEEEVVGWNREEGNTTSSSSCISGTRAIDSSNIGYRLLKRHGWQEGAGLGTSQQGRLEPVQVYLKTNKRGLGAEKLKKHKALLPHQTQVSNAKIDEEQLPSKGKSKALSKRMKKMLEEENRLQEKQFERDFFRLFWPDNV